MLFLVKKHPRVREIDYLCKHNKKQRVQYGKQESECSERGKEG